MGCEDFQVMLKSRIVKKVSEVRQFLAKHPNIAMLGDLTYEYSDGEHVVEFELRASEKLELSIRFALCNPASVDSVFIALVEEISDRFDLNVQVMDVVRGDEGVQQIGGCISFKRELWQKDFGLETAALGCDEALERYVLSS